MIKTLVHYSFLILVMFVIIKCSVVFLHNNVLLLLCLALFCVWDYLNNRTKHVKVVSPLTPSYSYNPYNKALDIIDELTANVQTLMEINKSMQAHNQRMIDIAQKTIDKIDAFEKKLDENNSLKSKEVTE